MLDHNPYRMDNNYKKLARAGRCILAAPQHTYRDSILRVLKAEQNILEFITILSEKYAANGNKRPWVLQLDMDFLQIHFTEKQENLVWKSRGLSAFSFIVWDAGRGRAKTLQMQMVMDWLPFGRVDFFHSAALITVRLNLNGVNVGCGPAEERVLLTGLHAVADIYCENCKTTLGWKYEHAFESSQKYKEGKFIIELAHMIKDNGWE
ncbi:YPEL1 protein, partial [Polypterus senegalus]